MAVARGCRDVEADRIRWGRHGLAAVVAQAHRPRLQRTSKFLFEPFARGTRLGEGQASGDRGGERGDAAPAVGAPP